MAGSNNKNMVSYIHVIIFLIIMFGVGLLPPFAQITELGMKVLGIFLGVIYGWLFIDLAWTSMFALVGLALIGYGQGGVNGLLVQGFSYQVLPQMILTYLFAEAIAQTKLTDYLSTKLLSMKFFTGKPFLLMFFFLMALFIMNLLHCGMAALFLMWRMFREMAAKAGYPQKNIFCTIMISSTLVVFVFAALAFPFNPGTLMQMSYFNQGVPDVVISPLGWMLLWIIFISVYIILWTLFTKFILRPDFSAIANIGDISSMASNNVVEKLDKEQKFGVTMLALFTVMVFSPALLPSEWGVTKVLNLLGLSGSIIIILAIMCIYRKADGNSFLSIDKASRGIMWNVVWLLIATEPIATAFNSADCGIMASVTAWAMPILMGMSPLVFLIISTLLLGTVTQVVHNLILIIVFIPILCPIYAQLGGNPLIMFFALFVAFNAAFTTPAASWSSAMMFGDSSVITSKMYVQGFLHFLFSAILALLFSPLAGIML